MEGCRRFRFRLQTLIHSNSETIWLILIWYEFVSTAGHNNSLDICINTQSYLKVSNTLSQKFFDDCIFHTPYFVWGVENNNNNNKGTGMKIWIMIEIGPDLPNFYSIGSRLAHDLAYVFRRHHKLWLTLNYLMMTIN